MVNHKLLLLVEGESDEYRVKKGQRPVASQINFRLPAVIVNYTYTTPAKSPLAQKMLNILAEIN
jgi:hypothetical protein